MVFQRMINWYFTSAVVQTLYVKYKVSPNDNMVIVLFVRMIFVYIVTRPTYLIDNAWLSQTSLKNNSYHVIRRLVVLVALDHLLIFVFNCEIITAKMAEKVIQNFDIPNQIDILGRFFRDFWPLSFDKTNFQVEITYL